MSAAFMIRPAAPEDYEGVCALHAEGDELHRTNVPWLFQAPSGEPRSLELFNKLRLGPDTAVFVADAGSIVGFATALMRTSPDFAIFIPQKWGVLDNIAVSKSWRRRGVGTALTREAERWAHTQGAKWIELMVYDFNDAARRFYEVLGYSPMLTKLRKPLPSAG
jgi:diamine N-acetyltransferase